MGQAEGTDLKGDLNKLVNFKWMSSKDASQFLKQQKAQIDSWTKNQIPPNFRIPVEMQSYRSNNSVRYYIIYNPAFKTGVGYIPSNLVQYYEEEAWTAYQKLGSNAPSLSIILAQQFTESAFNPQAISDNNMSCGLPQLYKKTADYLYKVDKQTWKSFFYFDKKGKHHFSSVKAMVQFPFVFLPKVKQYSAENRFDGLRRYNGAGVSAIQYAEKVMTRSLFYEELFAQNNAIPLDTTGFVENLFSMINLTLLSRNEDTLYRASLEEIFNNAVAYFSAGYVHKTYAHRFMIPVLENQPASINQTEENIIPVDGKDYYLIIEDGRALYDYFKQPDILFSTISNPKNKEFYLYYKQGKKKIKVTSLKQVGKRQVFSNVKPGDKLYILPGTVIRFPNVNMAIRIQ